MVFFVVGFFGLFFLVVIFDYVFFFSRIVGLKFRVGVCVMVLYWVVWLLVVRLWGLGIGVEVWWNFVLWKIVFFGELVMVVWWFF